MSKPRHRDPARIRFDVSHAQTAKIPLRSDDPPVFPWPVAAIGGGLAAALGGYLLVAGLVMIAWLGAIEISLATVLSFSGQVWLLANGGELVLDSARVTMVPLGITLLLAAMAGTAGSFAYRQGSRARTAEPLGRVRWRLVIGTAVQVAIGYTLPIAATAWGLVGLGGVLRVALPALAVSLLAALIGAGWSAGLAPSHWPALPAAVARGVLAGVLGLVGGTAALLALALIQGEGRIATLETAIGFDASGGVVWALVMVAYLPNLLGWVLAWALGGGFTVGSGSLVTIWVTQLGMLPSVPVLGALPTDGVTPVGFVGWMLIGVLAAVLAGAITIRGRTVSAVAAIGLGAAAGVVLAVVALGWAAASKGALGVSRFVDLGPRLPELAAIGMPLLLLVTTAAALVSWLAGRRAAVRHSAG